MGSLENPPLALYFNIIKLYFDVFVLHKYRKNPIINQSIFSMNLKLVNEPPGTVSQAILREYPYSRDYLLQYFHSAGVFIVN